jgi:DNA-binding transcriptional ArsR family regulator
MKKNIAQYYRALANPVRLGIFLRVAEESEGFAPDSKKKESCVTGISKSMKIPQPTVSNHLRMLEKVGLIKSVRVGTHAYQYVTKHSAQNLLRHAQYVFEQAHKNPY